MQEKGTKNRMGTMPVNRLMLLMGIPMVLSIMLQAVYNIVDSAFVSNMQDAGYMWLVWSTFVIAELLTVIIAAFFMKRINRHAVAQLQDM